jgi:hypothetical protein
VFENVDDAPDTPRGLLSGFSAKTPWAREDSAARESAAMGPGCSRMVEEVSLTYVLMLEIFDCWPELF